MLSVNSLWSLSLVLHETVLYSSLPIYLAILALFCLLTAPPLPDFWGEGAVAELDLHHCLQTFSSCREQWLFFISAPRVLTAMAFLVMEHSLQSTRASVLKTHCFSCSTACGILPGQRLNLGPLLWQADS